MNLRTSKSKSLLSRVSHVIPHVYIIPTRTPSDAALREI